MTAELTERAQQLDQADPLKHCRSDFRLNPGEVYLDGNSLGALPIQVENALNNTIAEQWGNRQIRSWNEAWIDLPQTVGQKIAPIIGANPQDVIATDSVSVNLFKLLAACLNERPERSTIVSVRDMFPTDLYIAQGLTQLLGPDRCQVKLIEIDRLTEPGQLDSDTNVVILSQVNFRTGEAYDIGHITEQIHAAGARVIWDVSHSAGVLPINASDNQLDFVVGCGYKFLNGGPGAPAFVYVRPDLQAELQQPLSGWMGHSDPFAFVNQYQPAPGTDRILAGTPNILSLTALNSALDVYAGLSNSDVFKKAYGLTSFFIEGLNQLEDESLRIITPANRGAQVSLTHKHAFPITQALIDAGIICDYRAPNIIRFGFSPLYVSYEDTATALQTLTKILTTQEYQQARFLESGKVT